ncbi:hypothetical protein PXW85_27395, partial [Klebsiella pneumoniae]|uniref:hypothetical protein n=1 Tax=Klebsiella pneumoniae TaxID=573 RepID=UPI002381737C
FIAPSLTWFGERATVTASYSHRDYSVPFDRGTIFDLNTGHAVSKRSGTNGADSYLQGYAVADVFAASKMKLQSPVTLQVN